MTARPYVLLSAAMSIDGYLDDAGDTPLRLSNDADFDRVDEVRAGVDAILVGANTIRRDNPRLLVRSPARRADRVARGLPETPLKVTVSRRGELDPAARFFESAPSLVYSSIELPALPSTVVVTPSSDFAWIMADLAGRGVRRLMVEGGGQVFTQLLTAGLADELNLVVAPLLVGDGARFLHNGQFRSAPSLVEVRRLGEVVLLRYLFGQAAADWRWLSDAVELSRLCPPSTTAFSVGAIVVAADGSKHSPAATPVQLDDVGHAEEVALSKVSGDPRLVGATVYSSLEPCSKRASRPRTCTQLLLAAGVGRVVFALREPSTFVVGEGFEQLSAAGVTVREVPDLAAQVASINNLGG